MFSRRAFLSSTTAAGATALVPPLRPTPARAQGYPNNGVRIIVPFPPGGATDVLGRVVAHHLQGLWGQTVVPEYKPGASGLLGARQVIASPADGYTLMLASTGAILSVAASQGAKPGNYNVTRELAPISLVAAPSYILVVNPSVPVKNAAEIIAYAKANPGKLTFGSSGAGTASHLSGALFAQMAGVDLQHVPYRGTGPAVNDLLGGQINMLFSPPQVVTQHIAAGKLRMIGITGAERSSMFPDFPTIASTGLPNYSSVGWFGLFAPAKTPAAIVRKISADTATILALDDAKKRLTDAGAEPAPNAPDVFTTFVNKDIAKWLGLAEKANIKLSP
ncbi:MAG: tripartite tricarboxylate transporter substrate binding protein [Rhizobiales bacterium]|nr:tripartite tricarboxylate transporter substrate binding protein [Hyphomicrobiales bacterium]